MDTNYPIYYLNTSVGTANVGRDGLYIQIQCSCSFQDQKIYKLYAESDDRQIPLGIPVPKNNRYILEKRIPSKNISDSNIRFYALCNEHVPANACFCVFKDVPFEQLADLNKCAYVRKVNGVLQIVMPPS